MSPSPSSSARLAAPGIRSHPGGSSGGSAAAVAAGIVPAAGANDGGGSIRTPPRTVAWWVSQAQPRAQPLGSQAPELWWGFVAEHAVTRTVRDSAALLDATCGSMPGSSRGSRRRRRPYLEEASRDPGRLRIAFSLDHGLGSSVHAENRLAMERATAVLAQAGHELEEVRLPIESEAFIQHFATLVAAEAAATIRLAESSGDGDHADLELPTWLLGRLGAALTGGVAEALYWMQGFFTRLAHLVRPVRRAA